MTQLTFFSVVNGKSMAVGEECRNFENVIFTCHNHRQNNFSYGSLCCISFNSWSAYAAWDAVYLG